MSRVHFVCWVNFQFAEAYDAPNRARPKVDFKSISVCFSVAKKAEPWGGDAVK